MAIYCSYTRFFLHDMSPDKPETPVLTGQLSRSDNGDVELTCSTTSSDVTGFHFYRGSTLLTAGPSNTFLVSFADISSQNGSYICLVAIDTVISDLSNGFVCKCRKTNQIVNINKSFYFFVLFQNQVSVLWSCQLKCLLKSICLYIHVK